jgi:hypothetical protein
MVQGSTSLSPPPVRRISAQFARIRDRITETPIPRHDHKTTRSLYHVSSPHAGICPTLPIPILRSRFHLNDFQAISSRTQYGVSWTLDSAHAFHRFGPGVFIHPLHEAGVLGIPRRLPMRDDSTLQGIQVSRPGGAIIAHYETKVVIYCYV